MNTSLLPSAIKQAVDVYPTGSIREQAVLMWGWGAAKIPVILASFELSKRYLLEPDRPVIDSPDKAAE